MDYIENGVIKAYNEIAGTSDSFKNHDFDVDSEISRELGFDSLGMIDFIVKIEKNLGIELDEYLGEIRKAKNIRDIIEILKEI